MYIILNIVIFVVILSITQSRFRTIYKVNIAFSLLWLTAISLSTTGLFGIYKPSFQVHMYSILTIFSFNTTYIIFGRNWKSNFDYNVDVTKIINTKIIILLNIFSWIYMSRFLMRSIPIIMSNGFNYLRIYAYDSELGLCSTIELLLAQIFVQAVFLSTMLITIFDFFSKKRHKYLYVLTSIGMTVYILAFAGRGMLTLLIACSIIVFVLHYFSKHKKPNVKFVISRKIIALVILFIVAVGGMYYLTMLRGWGDTVFLEEIYVYVVGPFPYLSELLEQRAGEGDIMLYGRATFGFIYNLAAMPVEYLLQLEYTGSDYFITTITAPYLAISDTRQFNALTTTIYPFIRDFGVMGIVFGSSFFAIFTVFVEKAYKKKGSIFLFLVYVILVYELLNSIKNYYLYSPNFGMLILILFLFTFKPKKSFVQKKRGV